MEDIFNQIAEIVRPINEKLLTSKQFIYKGDICEWKHCVSCSQETPHILRLSGDYKCPTCKTLIL